MDASGPTLEDWRALGLKGPAAGAELTRAFRTAVKAARPELHGGDEAALRRVIEAWRRVQTGFVAVVPKRAAAPTVFGLSPEQALRGGRIEIDFGGRRLRTTVPAGLRTGDRLRLKDRDGRVVTGSVVIRGDGVLQAAGDDLFMRWPVSPRLLEDGGRIEVETHAGPRVLWIVAGQTRPRLRLEGLGLPARGARPQGHLFVTLEASALAPSPAEQMLARFAGVWTGDRLAA